MNTDLFNTLADALRPENVEASEIKQPILADCREAAIRAFYWVSFNPDKRAERTIVDYSAQLEQDLEELPEYAREEYKQKYTRFFLTWLNASSRCASAAVAGPANFPTARNEKRMRSEQNHYDTFQQWRERAKKAINRQAAPPVTLLSELDRYTKQLEELKQLHALSIEGNKRIRQARKSGEDITQYLKEVHKVEPHMIDWALKFGFGTTNTLASIKRVEQRIKQFEAKADKSEQSGGQERKDFEGGFITIDYEADRIRIHHDTKPSAEIIFKLKSAGFKWSPFNQAWQRKNTRETQWAITNRLNINVKF